MNAAPAAADFGVVASLGELIALQALAPDGTALRVARRAALPGAHVSPWRSRGMEFAEARRYQSGDDARIIDWRQTARRGVPYVKLHQEEHELPLRLLVDLGASMRFGTRVAFKSVVAARAAALLAWSAVAAGDRVGGSIWHGATEQTLPPQGRRRGALGFVKALAAASAMAPAEAAPPLAQRLAGLSRTGGAVVLISDFSTLDAEAERRLRLFAKSVDLALLHVYDVFEASPPPGRYRLSDGARSTVVDLRSTAARAAYGADFAARRAALERLAHGSGIRLAALPTDGDLGALLRRVPLTGVRPR